MTPHKDRFWAKVLFSQFIKHYRKMTPEQKVADIDASMDALEDLDDTGDSFGAKMVRWSMERVDQYPMASENGKKGGRPRKNQETTADAPTREDGEFKSDSGDAGNLESATSANIYGVAPTREAGDVSATDSNISSEKDGSRQSRRTGTAVPELRRAAHSPAPVRSSGPMPANVQKVYDFASLEGLDKDDAYECWYVTTAERDGNDADGNPVTNWKAFVRTWCNTKSKKRSAQTRRQTAR